MILAETIARLSRLAAACLLSMAALPATAAPGQSLQPNECPGGTVHPDAVVRDAASLGSDGIRLASPQMLVVATRLSLRCGASVARVSHSAIVLDTGEFFEIDGDRVRFEGLARTQVESPQCAELPSAQRCLAITGVGGAVIALVKTAVGQSLRLVRNNEIVPILDTDGTAHVIDVSYLPAPDAAGGVVTVYVAKPAGGYLLILRSAL